MTTTCALVCTRNGRPRIGPTLAALAAQITVSPSCFEILVVDNGSTDDTAAFAQAALAGCPFPARIVRVPQPGKLAALLAGLHGTSTDLVTIVDDDNVLAPGFVATLLGVFESQPDVGVVGSHNTPRFASNATAPRWFASLSGQYACAGPAFLGPPEDPGSFAVVAGAGCTFRRAPVVEALVAGYSFFNDTTRHGSFWTTGEDTELCYLLGALGWRFASHDGLQLSHMMSPERLQWAYARRLARTIGTGALGIDPFILFHCEDAERPASARWTWVWQAAGKLRRLLRNLGAPLGQLGRHGEGDLRMIRFERDLGALLRIMRERGAYTAHLRRTRRFLVEVAPSLRRQRSTSTT